MSRRWRISAESRRARFWWTPPSLTQTIFPTGIPSEEAFGTPFINDGVLRPTGIPSAETFGTPTITTGPVTISPTGIPSAEAFGTPSVTITFDLTRLRRTVRPTFGYELVCVGRIMQPSGPPTFLEVDSIAWRGLSYTEELSKPPSLQAAALIPSLSDDTVQRLGNLRDMPTELWLYRHGQLVFAGPLTTWNTQSETITFYAPGLLGYLRYWGIETDTVFAGVDQFQIVKTLIDNWQATEFANYGIDTSAVGASGVTRDATYKQSENHNIGQRVEELGKRINGFDISVDPTTRQLNLWYPQQGTDRSTGEDSIVFDGLSITSNNIAASVAAGDIASDAMGTGTGTGDPIWAQVSNPEVRAKFGRAVVMEAFDGVSEMNTLTDHLSGLLDARDNVLLVPGPDLRVVADIPLSSYGVGDTVAFRLHERLAVEGAFRIRKRTVSVDRSGVEKVTLEFV